MPCPRDLLACENSGPEGAATFESGARSLQPHKWPLGTTQREMTYGAKPAEAISTWQRLPSFMNLASTQLRTLSTVELELMQRRRTSDSHAARMDGVTSGGILYSSDAPAELENAINAIVANGRMFIYRLAIMWIEVDAFDPMGAAE